MINMRRLLFFLLFFISSFHAKSSDYDPAYFYYTNYSMWVYYGVSQTPMGACSKITHPEFGSGASVIRDSSNVWSCMSSFIPSQDGTLFLGQVFRGTCPNHPICSEPPPSEPNNCPSPGTIAGYGLLDPSLGSSGNYRGCRVTVSQADLNCSGVNCEPVYVYEHTGDQSTASDPEINIPDDQPEFDAPPLGKYVEPNNTETIIIPTQLEFLADGTSVRVDQTIYTEIRGAGTDRVETEQTTVVNLNNGITKTTTETVTTVTNPDGSATVTTESHTAYTGFNAWTHTINKDNEPPTHSVSTTEPITASNTTIKTESFNSQGQKTSESTQTTSSSGNLGSGHNPNLADDFANSNTPESSNDDDEDDCSGDSCKASPYESSGSWWESSYPDGLSGIFETHKDALIQASMIGVITDTSGISSSGSFPLFTFPGYTIGPMSVPASAIELDARVVPFMRVAFLFIAAVVCRRLIFGG